MSGEDRKKSAILKMQADRPTDPEAVQRRTRTYRRLLAQLVKDAGGDLSKAQQIIAENAAAMAIMCQEHVADWMTGCPLDVASYNTVVNSLRRQLETLGIERKARDITPRLDRYIAEKGGPVINGKAVQ